MTRLEKLREKEPTFEGNTEEDIRARLVAAQEAMLKVELDKAEAEARRLEGPEEAGGGPGERRVEHGRGPGSRGG